MKLFHVSEGQTCYVQHSIRTMASSGIPIVYSALPAVHFEFIIKLLIWRVATLFGVWPIYDAILMVSFFLQSFALVEKLTDEQIAGVYVVSHQHVFVFTKLMRNSSQV